MRRAVHERQVGAVLVDLTVAFRMKNISQPQTAGQVCGAGIRIK